MRIVTASSLRKPFMGSVTAVPTIGFSKLGAAQINRTKSSNFVPGSVQAPTMRIVQRSPSFVGSTSIATGAGATFVVSATSALDNALMLAQYEYSIHVGSIAASTMIPGGSSIDENDYQVIVTKSILNLQSGVVSETVPEQDVLFVYVGNNSGSTQTIYLQGRFKYILGIGNDAEGASI